MTFTDEQWATLQRTFPTGVCDWSKPSVGETPTVPWLTYARKPGGEELGPVPVSAPYSSVRALRVRSSLKRLRRAGVRSVPIVLVKPADSVPARRVSVRVYDAKGRLLASSRARTVRSAQTVVQLRKLRRIAAGTVTARVRVFDALGRSVPSPTARIRLGR